MASRDAKGQFQSGPDHPRAIDRGQRLLELKSLDLGTLTITGEAIVSGERSRQMVETYCHKCTKTRLLLVDNLLGHKTKNCRCQRGRKYENPQSLMLARRFDAAYQRCNNPNDPNYDNYGGRGIEMRFTRADYVGFMQTKLQGEGHSSFDIDRDCNDGHYEPGNLLPKSRSENLRNKRTNRFYLYNDEKIVAADVYARIKSDFPQYALSKGTTAKLAAAGVPLADMLARKARPNTLRRFKGKGAAMVPMGRRDITLR